MPALASLSQEDLDALAAEQAAQDAAAAAPPPDPAAAAPVPPPADAGAAYGMGVPATDPAVTYAQDPAAAPVAPPPAAAPAPAPVPASTSEATADPTYAAPVAPPPAPYASPSTDTYQPSTSTFVDGNGNTGYVPAPTPTSTPPVQGAIQVSPPLTAINTGAGGGLGNIVRPTMQETLDSRDAYQQRRAAGVRENPLPAPTPFAPRAHQAGSFGPSSQTQRALAGWNSLLTGSQPPDQGPATALGVGSQGVGLNPMGGTGQGVATDAGVALGLPYLGLWDAPMAPDVGLPSGGGKAGKPYPIAGEAGYFVDVAQPGKVSPTTVKTRYRADPVTGEPVEPYVPAGAKGEPNIIPDAPVPPPGPTEAQLIAERESRRKGNAPQPIVDPQSPAAQEAAFQAKMAKQARPVTTPTAKPASPGGDVSARFVQPDGTVLTPDVGGTTRVTKTDGTSYRIDAAGQRVPETPTAPIDGPLTNIKTGRPITNGNRNDLIEAIANNDDVTTMNMVGKTTDELAGLAPAPAAEARPVSSGASGQPIAGRGFDLTNAADRTQFETMQSLPREELSKHFSPSQIAQFDNTLPRSAPDITKPLPTPVNSRLVGVGNVQREGVPIPGTTRARTAIDGTTPAPTTAPAPRPAPKTAPAEPSYIQQINTPSGMKYQAVESGKTTGPIFAGQKEAATYLQGRKAGAPEVRPAPEAAVPEAVKPNWREAGFRSQRELDAATERSPTIGKYETGEVNPVNPPSFRQRVANDAKQFAGAVPIITGVAGAGVFAAKNLINGFGENVEGKQIRDRRAALDAQGQDAQQYFGQRTGSTIAEPMTTEQEAALRQFYGMPAYDPPKPGGHAGQNFPYPFSRAPQSPIDRVNELKDNTAVGNVVGPWMNQRGWTSGSRPTADFAGGLTQGGVPPLSLPGLNLPVPDPRQALDAARRAIQGTPTSSLPDFPPGVGSTRTKAAPNVDIFTAKDANGNNMVLGAINEKGQYEAFPQDMTNDAMKQRLDQINAAKNPATAPVASPSTDTSQAPASASPPPPPASAATSPPPAATDPASILPLAGPADMATADGASTGTPLKDSNGKDTGLVLNSDGTVSQKSGGGYSSGSYHKSYGSSGSSYRSSGSSRYSKKKKKKGSSSFGGPSSGMWDGFPFNRPPSSIRQLVLDAIASSQAKGKSKK